jgi:hypothetical protein
VILLRASLLERALRRGECIHPSWMIMPPYAGKHSAQPSRVSPLDTQKAMPVRQPLEMPGRYGFHSTRPGLPTDLGWSPFVMPTPCASRRSYRTVDCIATISSPTFGWWTETLHRGLRVVLPFV